MTRRVNDNLLRIKNIRRLCKARVGEEIIQLQVTPDYLESMCAEIRRTLQRSMTRALKNRRTRLMEQDL